jgi:hypothetical protein
MSDPLLQRIHEAQTRAGERTVVLDLKQKLARGDRTLEETESVRTSILKFLQDQDARIVEATSITELRDKLLGMQVSINVLAREIDRAIKGLETPQ